MRRLIVTASVLAALAAQTSYAFAGGPIFVTVPTHSDGGRPSLAASIHRQISVDEHAVARLRLRQKRLNGRLGHLQTQLQHAVDPFGYQDAIVRVERVLTSTRSRAAALNGLIRRLRGALQPIKLPVRPTTRSGSAVGWDAVEIAEHYLGVRYLWGGSNPGSGFDCSGFVKFVYAQLGLTLPHYAATQFARTPHIDPMELQAGDLVFFEPRADGPGHVGIYIGDGGLIEAPHTGDVVKLTSVAALGSALGFVGATRPAELVG